MKVKDLREYLEKIKGDRNDELEVMIPVKFPTPSIGPRSSVPVANVSRGIDWDNGRFFIWADRELKADWEE